MRKDAIYVVAVNGFPQRCFEESVLHYAGRIGVPVFVIRKNLIENADPRYTKLLVWEHAEKVGYERVLLLDYDLLIRADCPDLFPLLAGDIAAVQDLQYDQEEECLDDTIFEGIEAARWWQTNTNSPPEDPVRIFNTGVMLGRVARVKTLAHWGLKVAEKYRWPDRGLADQGVMNAAASFHRADLQMLPIGYNRLVPLRNRYSSGFVTGEMETYVLHFAGLYGGRHIASTVDWRKPKSGSDPEHRLPRPVLPERSL